MKSRKTGEFWQMQIPKQKVRRAGEPKIETQNEGKNGLHFLRQ